MIFLQSLASKAFDKVTDLFAAGAAKTFDGLDRIEQSGLAAAAKHAGNKVLDSARDAAAQGTEIVLDTALGIKESVEESKIWFFFEKGKLGGIVIATGKRVVTEISADKLGAMLASCAYSTMSDAAAQEQNPVTQMALYALAIAPAVLFTAHQASRKLGNANSNAITCAATATVLAHAVAPFAGPAGAELARAGGTLLTGAVGGYLGYAAVGGQQEFIDSQNPLNSYAVQVIAIPAALNVALPAGANAAKAAYAGVIPYVPQIKDAAAALSSNGISMVQRVETALGGKISATILAQMNASLGANMTLMLRSPIDALAQDSAHIFVKGLQEFAALLQTSDAVRAAYEAFHAHPNDAQAFDALELAVLAHLERTSPVYRQLYYALKPTIESALAAQKEAIDGYLKEFEEQMGFPLVNAGQRQQLEKLMLVGLLSYFPFVIANSPNLVAAPITRQQERGLMLDALRGLGALVKETELAPVAGALVPAGQVAFAAQDAVKQGRLLIEEAVNGPQLPPAPEPAERPVLTSKERIKQFVLFVVLSLFQAVSKLLDFYKQGLTFGSVAHLSAQTRDVVGHLRARAS